MLKFLRAAPATTRTEPAPLRTGPRGGPDVPTNADKARALMALLEQGGDQGSAGIAPERLRDWARDLVETVEKRRAVGEANGSARPAPPARPSGLFKAPAPRMRPTPDDQAAALPGGAAPSADPALASSTAAPEPAPAGPTAATMLAATAFRAAPVAAPVGSEPEAPARRTAEGTDGAVPSAPAMMARADLRRLIDATTDPDSLSREHPAIIAMTLVGKPTLEQAAAIRRLPGGQVRAVHRALRAMEGVAG